jgi:hypothetical protein
MLTRTCFGVAVSLMTLALLGATAAPGAPAPSEPPRPETVAKLIAQLGSDDFRSRREASVKLEKLGGPALPALRKAAKAKIELEVKRRLEGLVARIEKALLRAEEKHWDGLDAARRGIKDRVVKVLTRPALSDQEAVSALYLLTVARPPTAGEAAQARKQIEKSDSRLVGALRLTRSLAQGKEVNLEVAAANGRLVKVRKDLAGEAQLVNRLHRLNSPEMQKITEGVAASLDRAVKSDERLVDLAFLLALSRFPRPVDAASAVAYLKKKAKNRSLAASDLVWALINTKEFLMAP